MFFFTRSGGSSLGWHWLGIHYFSNNVRNSVSLNTMLRNKFQFFKCLIRTIPCRAQYLRITAGAQA